MANYEAKNVQCPFYRASERKGGYIRCEGIAGARNVLLIYRSERQRIKQMEIFCQNCYDRCEIYRAIVESKGLED
jgi:hypothetical protein